MRRYADANVFLRYLLGDVPDQSKKAQDAIRDGVWISEVVLAEIVYVLSGVYAMPRRELTALLTELLDEVTCENKAILKRTLELFRVKRKLDFVDCLLAAHKQVAADEIVTFDKALIRELAVG